MGLRAGAGFRAKKNGASFEELIEARSRIQGITYVQIPDGCKQISAFKTIRVPTPFDVILGFGKNILFCDLKSTEGNSFTYSMIKPHQLRALSELSKHGQRSGFLVFFRSCNRVVFFNSRLLSSVKPGTGLSPNDGLFVGKIDALDLQFCISGGGI